MCVFCTFFYVSDVSKVSVLVPGAGLGRLAWEIARLGYSCQGNEWSFFMLFTSNFILNRYKTFCHSYVSLHLQQIFKFKFWNSFFPFRCEQVNSLTVYPWIHQFSNNKKCSDQTRGVRFPDVNPQSLPPDVDFSMVAGDFVEVYNEAGQFKLIELFTLSQVPAKQNNKRYYCDETVVCIWRRRKKLKLY